MKLQRDIQHRRSNRPVEGRVYHANALNDLND
jgi:hypothetical protein